MEYDFPGKKLRNDLNFCVNATLQGDNGTLQTEHTPGTRLAWMI
jgi:hypothetical protein